MAQITGTVGGTWGTAGEGVVGAGLAYEIWLQVLPGIVADITSLFEHPEAQQASVDKWTLICNAIAVATVAHTTVNAQSLEAANQAVFLKDRLTATNNLLMSTNTNLTSITAQLTSLCTNMALAETDDALINANILTMITAWNTLNIGLSAPDPLGTGAVALLAVSAFQTTMGTLVTSWTALAASHTARVALTTANATAIATAVGLIATDLTAIAAESTALVAVTLPTSDSIV